MRRLLLLAAASLALVPGCPPLLAQAQPLAGAIASHPAWPQAKQADVDSIDHIVAAVYDVISGPAHQPRDWTRMRSLFVPDARLVPVRVTPGKPNDLVFLSIDDYIARSSARMENDGFVERGVHNEVKQFNNLVSVFSTYESRHAATDAMPFARGINSIQLLNDGRRYWIEQIYWDAERPGSPIPASYLPAALIRSGDFARPGASFAGDWTGTLEYRDFKTDQPVKLPTRLTIRSSSDGRALTFAYTFDDGPGKQVHETSTLTLFPQARSATISSEGERTATAYSVEGFDEFTESRGGTLVLTGQGTDNDKPADVRLTVTLDATHLTWRKETRPTDGTGEFQFRDAYTLTRAAPSA